MAYPKIKCSFCKKMISKGGAAYTAHMRMHVRKGEAKEIERGNKLEFVPIGFNLLDEEPYAKLGNDIIQGQPKDVWEMPDLSEWPTVRPEDYFITSGEAIKKINKMIKDIYALASKARSTREKLEKARGGKKYLETMRADGRLLVKAKNARVRKSQ